MHRRYIGLAAGVGLVSIVVCAAPAAAQVAPSLGAAQSFAVLGGTSVANTGPTVVNGNLGISPGIAVSITNFPPGIVNGATYAGPLTLAGQAQTDRNAALINLQGQPCTDSAGATVFGVTTISPGVHCYTSTLLVNGPVTLNAFGNPNAVFIFKVGSSLTTAVGSQILLAGGAQACNVFWAVAVDTTIEVSSTFVGNVIGGRDFVARTNAHMFGRALTFRDLTLDSNIVDATVCASASFPGGSCPAGLTEPVITTIPNQAIAVNGSTTVGFTISGGVIAPNLLLSATSSDTNLVPRSAMVFGGSGSARTLTVTGADGRSGTTTITITVTDSQTGCSSTSRFQLAVGAPTAVPTLSQWAMIALTLLLATAGVVAMRRRNI
jgi:hypothetical protein